MRKNLLLIGCVALGVAGCPTASDVARPDDPTAAEALGEDELSCEEGEVPDEGTPLVVHWQDGARASLETAMDRGVAVVRYTCDGMEVLRACSAPGQYEYSGVSRKENMISMRDGAEAQANLGTGLSAIQGIEASLESGRSLDLAYVLVGMDSTTVARVSEAELEGRCEGATHFVYDVSRGAFALDTSAGTEGRAAADLFGRGAGAEAEAHRDVEARDGDPAACEASSATDAAPLEACRAPLRVSVLSIDPEAAEPAAPSSSMIAGERRDPRSCPAGFVYADDQCVREAEAEARLCPRGDADACLRECGAGSAGSCARLSTALARVIHSPDSGREATQDALDTLEGVEPALREACEAGEGAACSSVAVVRFRDLTGDARERNQREGMEYAEKGCVAGDAHACRMVRRAYTTESGRIVGVELDPDQFSTILERGCARGAPLPCQYLAELYALGYAAPRDLAAAGPLAERACEGGLASACVFAAGVSLPGTRCAETLEHYNASLPADAMSDERTSLPADVCPDTTPDESTASGWLTRACHLGDDTACGLASR